MKKYRKPQITVINVKAVSFLMGSDGPSAIIKNPGISSTSGARWLEDDFDFDDED